MSFFAFRRRLSQGDEFVFQTLIGLVIGMAVAVIVMMFHELIDVAASASQFEDWPWWQRLLLPIAGAIACYALLQRHQNRAQLGVGHVIETLHRAPRHWPVTNAILQFLLTPVLLASGQSGGREGPAVHLGATFGAWMTERMHLPRNNLRVFVGAGAAAAISSTFGTPLAGVAFAMEVVVMEYTVAGFLPIIAAAVAASWLIGILVGAPLVSIPDLSSMQSPDLGWVLVLGLGSGLISAAFNWVVRTTAQHRPRFGVIWAGVICGAVGVFVPDVMGDGFYVLGDLLATPSVWQLLVLLLVCKLLVTGLSLGLGMPIGFIGPLLLMGAAWGALVGLASGAPDPLLTLIGMTAVMGGALFAPLAAVLAVIELSQQTDLILPAMTAVAIAILLHRLLGQEGLFVHQLADAGRPLALHRSNHPMHHLGVDAAIRNNVVQINRRFNGLPKPADVVVWGVGRRQMRAMEWLEFVKASNELAPGSDLATVIQGHTLERMHNDATLAEVWAHTRASHAQGAYFRHPNGRLNGIIWRTQLEDQFQ
ncbi:hypothetical protein GH975_11135 [Litorivicinus lipolyticus]|uniref:H+/Cl-antiporter ClcA n=1 Tax=Litorivicinus lipolyticus TaxID=418701 RepID=A0A5Q2QJ50_9GAMM|nr:chloride channel protein [Litorivicinus lipolyticus]QGG81085.1 hypothetical protein GH975_11135 [Litorivicinus lipolyticus]